MTLDIRLERRYVDDPPAEIEARRQRIYAILHKYRHYLLTPPETPLTIELPSMAERGEDHD